MTKIGSIVSFCTHDLRFLDKCIRGITPFSHQIIIPVCDHFYNGKPEDTELLQRIYAKYPQVQFIEFAFSKDEVYGTPSPLVFGSPGWAQHWHNTARLVGYYFLPSDVDFVLFLDVDEIFEKSFHINDFDAIRFATYWYFKKAGRVATIFPDGPLLVRKNKLTLELLIDEDERYGILQKISGKKGDRYMEGAKPLVHHYSWVRKRDEMLAKVKSWGHHWERDWENLIDQDKDFVRGYTYKKIKPFWDPLKEKIALPNRKKAPFCKVTQKDIFRMQLKEMSRS